MLAVETGMTYVGNLEIMGIRKWFLVAWLGLYLEIRISCGLNLEFYPPEGAFFVKSIPDAVLQENLSHGIDLFMLNGCPSDQLQLTASHAGFHADLSFKKFLRHGEFLPKNCRVSVKLVNKNVILASPLIRVLVSVDEATNKHQNLATKNRCVDIYATYGQEAVAGSCQLLQNLTCLVSLTVPLSWWDKRHSEFKVKPRALLANRRVQLFYLAHEMQAEHVLCHVKGQTFYDSLVQLSLLKQADFFDEVSLLNKQDYTTVPIDASLKLFVPNLFFYPGMMVTIPVHFDPDSAHINTFFYPFQLRVESSEKLRIIGLTVNPDSGWMLQQQLNRQHDALKVTVFPNHQIGLNLSWSGEMFTLLVRLPARSPGAEALSGHLNWSAGYVQVDDFGLYVDETPDNVSTPRPVYDFARGAHVVTELMVLRDRVVAILPVCQNFEMMNTAVLSGRRVLHSMKIYSISHGGSVNDVTLNCSCIASVPAVLKITPNCTTVYLDGSETRGSLNATVSISYQHVHAKASFTVWYPERPLDVTLSDPVLHAIRHWRLPVKKSLLRPRLPVQTPRRKRRKSKRVRKRRKERIVERRRRSSAEQFQCKLRFQDAQVQVFARFKAEHRWSGRRSFLGGLGRLLLFDVTALVSPHVRVRDQSVATLRRHGPAGRLIVQGIGAGRTEVEVAHPGGQDPFGVAYLEVTREKVSLKYLRAIPLTGINLTLEHRLYSHPANLFLTKVAMDRGFHVQHQKGVVSLSIEYSDNMISYLSDIDAADIRIMASSRNRDTVIVGDAESSEQSSLFGSVPKLLALSDHARGAIIELEFRAPETCERIDGLPLLTTTAFVETNFVHRASSDITTISSDPLSIRADTSSVPDDVIVINSLRKQDDKRSSNNELTAFRKGSHVIREGPVSEGSVKRKNGHGSTYSGLEIAIFVLLGVLASAVSLVATNRVLSRAQGSGYKFYQLVPKFMRLSRDPQEIVVPCQEWVYVSPEQLKSKAQVSVEYSRRSPDNTLWKCSCRAPLTSSPQEDDGIAFAAHSYDLTPSLGSRESAEHSTHSNRSQNPRISYEGSEVSIHMTPQPCMEIHDPLFYSHRPDHGPVAPDRRTASWNSSRCPRNHRVRITTNPILDSSSEQNLSTLVPLAKPEATRGKGKGMTSWDSSSLGLDDIQMRHYFSGLRETNA